VISNVAGAAAYNGHLDILTFLIRKAVNLNLESSEKPDHSGKKPFTKEISGFTPLMLSVIGSDKNLPCVKFLLQHKVKT